MMFSSVLRNPLHRGVATQFGTNCSNSFRSPRLRSFSTNSKGSEEPTSDDASSSSAKAKPTQDDYKDKKYDNLPISFADISRAEVAIRGGVKRTSCEHSPFISELVGANVYFKPEFRQFTGSFKERGARNAILSLMREQKDNLRGIVAASAGNHAQALAYHGRQLGVPATVVMPKVAPMAKVDKCRVCRMVFDLFIWCCWRFSPLLVP